MSAAENIILDCWQCDMSLEETRHELASKGIYIPDQEIIENVKDIECTMALLTETSDIYF